MARDRSRKKQQAKAKEKQKEVTTKVEASPTITSNGTTEKEELKISPRSVTGVLASHPLSRDIKFENFSLGLGGTELVKNCTLEFNYGNRYGLIGLNGSGKSTLLTCLGQREIPIPEHITIFHLDREEPPSELTAIETIIKAVEEEAKRLEAEAEHLAALGDEGSEKAVEVYEMIDELDPPTAKARASEILYGLGFTKEMQETKTKDFSGGWRMRIALARALFVKPGMLLLDEPTNHLDLEACVWLEEYLKKYRRILVLVSHSQDFLNNVCTHIIHLTRGTLKYYGGNYDTYVKTRAELEEHQMKIYNREQEEIAHMKEYIARFGHGSAKLARQAKSKEKQLNRMQESGLTEKVVQEKVIKISFPPCRKLPPPVLQFTNVSFSYSGDKKNLLYRKLDFGVDLDSRVALVGPNGAGKSTLLKLMAGELVPVDGSIRRHHHLQIAWYHQHLTDQLDLDFTPLKWMLKCFPEIKEEETMRRAIGKFGITGKTQTSPMTYLSDGQKSRVVFAWLAFKNPHLLLLDEPTNHLDIETIDALAEAINEFDGGMVLVSHDFRLINQVAKEIWVCEKGTVTTWKGDIQDYKQELRRKMNLE